MIEVCIVHRTRKVRDSLLALIGGTEGFTCVGVHARIEEAWQKAALEKPQIVLMDLAPPDPGALHLIRQWRARFPKTEFLVLIPSAEPGVVLAVLEAGAGGCLAKPVAPVDLLKALMGMRYFGVAISGEVAWFVVNAIRKRGAARRALESLTRRESEVLECLSKGYATKEIAHRCSISVQTVNTHLAHIYGKLRVRSRTAALGKLFASTPR